MLCSCDVQNVEKMPEIVLMCFTEHADGAGRSIAFIDSVGNQYYTDNKVISDMNAIDVYNEFVNGDLEDILVLKGTCAQSELAENYALIKKVAENENYELVSDTGYSMGIETAKTSWIGFYYADGDVPKILTLRKSGYDGGGYTYRK